MADNDSFFYSISSPVLMLSLLISMLLLLKIGRMVGTRLRKSIDQKSASLNTTVVGSVLALFAFLLGFTFSMSGSQFEARRINNISEANAIGTALSRADLYPAAERSLLRADFKEYILARANYFSAGNNLVAMQNADKKAQHYATLIWNRASADAVNANSVFPANLMIPALNEMMDSANTNNYGEKFRVPDPIILLLLSISLVCAFFVGYYTINNDRFSATMNIGFCVLVCLVIYTTFDLGSSRTGLIKHHTSLRALGDLLQQFDHQ